MNQELKQRLIGAVVVTALAAIFIPMLFDDPVDNSSQSVSELVIPATPVKTGEESANKLPTSANQILNAPDSGSEAVVNTEEEAELTAINPLSNDETLGDEPEVNTEDDAEQPIDELANDGSPTALETDVVDEPDKPIKTKKILQEAESSMKKPPLEEDIVATPEKPVKKTESSATKHASKVKPLTTETINKTEKPVVKPAKSSSEFSRWTIQAGTFSKKENAVALMETLRKQGLPVTLEATRGGLYRLKVGPVLEKKRAVEMKAKLDNQKIQSILIAE
jgi:DedD protein